MISLEQAVHQQLALAVPVEGDERAINEAVKYAFYAQNFISLMLKGEISPEELLEAIEPCVPSIDDYIEQSEYKLERLTNDIEILIARY